MPTSAALFPGDLAHAFPASQIGSTIFIVAPVKGRFCHEAGPRFGALKLDTGGVTPS